MLFSVDVMRDEREVCVCESERERVCVCVRDPHALQC